MNDLPLLWTFYQVAKAGGVSAGAKRLFVTQSAASQALKNLEVEYKVILAERSRSGFGLTEAGQKLLLFCEETFSKLETVRGAISNANEEPEGEVTLGCDITTAMAFFFKHAKILGSKFPKLKILIRATSTSLMQTELLEAGEVDVACINRDYSCGHERWQTVPLQFPMPVYLYASPAYLKAHDVKKVADIFKLTFIEVTPSREAAKWFFRTCLNQEPAFTSYHYLSSDFIPAVTAGLGVTISPEPYVAKELKSGALVKVSPKILKVERKDDICVLKARQDLPKIRAVLDYFRQDFS